MESFFQHIQDHAIEFWSFLPLLLYGFIAFIFFLFFGFLIATMVKRTLRRSSFSGPYESFFIKLVRWLFGIAGFLVALKIMGFSGIATSILAGGGVTAIVLGFAFRDIGENILSGFFLAFSRPFNVGDLIRSEELEGRVKSVELRHTHIRTGDGCDIFIPSAQIFNRPLYNFTRDGLRRADFTIGIDYSDNVQAAMELLARRMDKIERLLKEPKPTVRIASFTPAYVELRVTFWINTFKQEQLLASIRTEVMETCRIALLDHKFTISSNVKTALEMDRLNVRIEKQGPLPED